MSETKWTPGNWEIVSEWRSDFVVGVRSKSGAYSEVCEIDWFAEDDDEALANAHLIAAAPDLYDELDAMSQVLGKIAVAAAQEDWEAVASICFAETGVDFHYDGTPRARTKSLAKARGESNE